LAELAADCRFVAVDAVLDRRPLPWDEAAFADLQHAVREDGGPIAASTLLAAAGVLVAARGVRRRLERLVADSVQRSAADAAAHLDRLAGRHFVITAGVGRIADVRRFVDGIAHRLDRLAGDVERDVRRMTQVVALERRYAAYLRSLGRARPAPDAAEVRWLLEELRISVFAQPLSTAVRVSPQRVAERLAAIGA
jgi:ATP-dependent helicase HrpA